MPPASSRVVLEVERLELQSELAARQQDQLAGRAPVWARRSLLPHEIAARVSFTAIADAADAAGMNIGRRLTQDRQAIALRMAEWLADAPNAAVVAVRLADLQRRGIGALPGAGPIITAAERAFEAELQRLALEGAARAAAEAVAQGVAVDLSVDLLDAEALGHLHAASLRLAVGPHQELVAALQAEAARLGPIGAAELVARLEAAALSLSAGPLELQGRMAATSADGIGRQAVAARNPQGRRPARVYASEILDGSTCGPCSLVDGREFGSLEEARLLYPAGIYRDCEGGPRCRGTLVFVWEDEELPTLPSPGPR